MAEHTHDDGRLTFGCPACIEAARPPKATPTNPTVSSGRRLTAANRKLLRSGTHPATHRRLLGEHTCGECSHHHCYLWHTKRYHKCDLHRLGESHSEASDIRISWPACVLWEPA